MGEDMRGRTPGGGPLEPMLFEHRQKQASREKWLTSRHERPRSHWAWCSWRVFDDPDQVTLVLPTYPEFLLLDLLEQSAYFPQAPDMLGNFLRRQLLGLANFRHCSPLFELRQRLACSPDADLVAPRRVAAMPRFARASAAEPLRKFLAVREAAP